MLEHLTFDGLYRLELRCDDEVSIRVRGRALLFELDVYSCRARHGNNMEIGASVLRVGKNRVVLKVSGILFLLVSVNRGYYSPR